MSINEEIEKLKILKQRSKLKWVLVAVCICLIIGFGIPLFIEYNPQLKPASKEFRPVLVRVKQGMTAKQLADELQQKKIIRDNGAFVRYLKLHQWDKKISAGDYEFSPSYSSKYISRMLANKKVTDTWITIPEGLRLTEIAALMNKKGVCSETDFINACSAPAKYQQYVSFDLPKDNLEGYLFPNTYRMPPGLGADEAIITLLKTFDKEIYIPNKDKLTERGMSLTDALVMASIIEREARHDSDRPIMASVINNRLKYNMPLGMCSSVQYALGYWKSKLYENDLKVISPYNTYTNKGLPPGPISNPGEACFKAVLNPEQTDYLYFLVMPNGYHKFSKNYEEHLQAKEKYLE